MFVETEFPLQQPLLIRLMEDVGKIPGGIICELPREHALSLVRRRLAIPVGDLNAVPDVTIDETDLDAVFGTGHLSCVVDISAAADETFEPLLNDHQAAERLGVSPATMRSWRCRGIGPNFVKFGRGSKAPVRYDVSDLETFISESRQVPSVRAAQEI